MRDFSEYDNTRKDEEIEQLKRIIEIQNKQIETLHKNYIEMCKSNNELLMTMNKEFKKEME